MEAAFLAAHDRYIEAMDLAYATGDTTALEAWLAPTFHGYYAGSGVQQADFFSLADALAGIRQTARAMPGVRTHCDHRLVRMRSETEAMVFYYKRMEHAGVLRAFAFVLEAWQESGAWQLVRETVEAGYLPPGR